MKITRRYNLIALLAIYLFLNQNLKAQDGGKEFGLYNNLYMQNQMIGMPVNLDWGFYVGTGLDINTSLSTPYLSLLTRGKGFNNISENIFSKITDVFNFSNDNQYIVVDVTQNLLGVGFVVKDDIFLTFGVDAKSLMQFSYSNDLLGLVAGGNYDGEKFNEININDFRIYSSQYAAIYGGASWEAIPDKLRVGFKASFLIGVAGIDANFNNLTLNFQNDRESGAGYKYRVDYDGYINTMIEYDLGKTSLPAFDKYGFALDLGATYYLKEFDLYAGIQNAIGFINMGNDAQSATFSNGFDINGVKSNKLAFASISDSISNISKKIKGGNYDVKKESFNMFLPPIINMGALYNYSDESKFGVQSELAFYQVKTFYGITPFYLYNYNDYFISKVGYNLTNRINSDFNVHVEFNVGFSLTLDVQNVINAFDYENSLSSSAMVGIAWGDFSRSKKVGREDKIKEGGQRGQGGLETIDNPLDNTKSKLDETKTKSDNIENKVVKDSQATEIKSGVEEVPEAKK